jgi:hypothetical protein
MGDWTLDLVSKPGVAMIKRSESENNPKNEQKQLTTTTTTTTTTTNPSKQEAK